MSLFGSLFSGVSGLAAQSQSMGMISDNVSNVNTVAYKGAVAQFSTLVTRSEGSATFSPGGVRAGTLYEIADQGLIQASNSPTDVAIDGRGFFAVNTEPDASGEQVYTRAGDFRSDLFGNLRNSAGFYLQGWELDANEEVIDRNQMETVRVDLVSGSVAPTTRVEAGVNLDATQAAFTDPYTAGDMASGNVEPHFTQSIDVVDSLGQTHNVTLAFLNTSAPATPRTWQVEVYADPSELQTAGAGAHPANGLVADGEVSFNGDGTLAGNTLTPVLGGAAADPLAINWAEANGADDSAITLDLGTIGDADGLSQFDADYSVAFTNQNGSTFGELTAVNIDEEGFVIASFSNGRTKRLYQLPVATFANPSALDPRSGNVFAETDASGTANLREADSGGAGKIAPSALETANVDLADEFTKMIVTQRAYSANARVISTTDEMLDELVRISG